MTAVTESPPFKETTVTDIEYDEGLESGDETLETDDDLGEGVKDGTSNTLTGGRGPR